MKLLALTLLAIPLIASCSGQDTGTDVDTDTRVAEPSGNASGAMSEFKVGDGQFSFTLNTERGPRFITTKHSGSRITSTIERLDGRLLFEVAVEFDGGSMIVSERTETDRLWIRHTQGTRQVREHFNLNGRDLVVVYPTMDQLTMTKSFDRYQRGEYENLHPKLLQAFQSFDRFYRTDNSLHWNPDGESLVATLLSPELSEELRRVAAAKLANGDGLETAGERKEAVLWCATVSVGTGLKCFFGGPANALCLIGTAHSIACGIYEIVCALWTC